MNHDSPDVDEDKERNVGKLLQRQNEWEDVVWNGLRKSIKGMEGMRSEGRWHDPLVVWLVEVLVDPWMVKTPVDPVDEEVCEEEEDGELEDIVPHSWTLLCRVVDLAVATNLKPKRSRGQDGHAW
jgi:hypothetical protein